MQTNFKYKIHFYNAFFTVSDSRCQPPVLDLFISYIFSPLPLGSEQGLEKHINKMSRLVFSLKRYVNFMKTSVVISFNGVLHFTP